MKVKFTATFSGIIEIDEEDERFLQPSEDSAGNETEEFEPFSPFFALEILTDDFYDDPEGFTGENRESCDITFEDEEVAK